MGVPASDVSRIANCKGTCEQTFPHQHGVILSHALCETDNRIGTLPVNVMQQ